MMSRSGSPRLQSAHEGTDSAAGHDELLTQLSINTIRTLAMDAVQAANSGHPGTPMALAPVIYTLWQNFLRFDPDDPIWPNRDRFVLSNGHASMLLYAMLHLAAVKAVDSRYERLGTQAVSLDDIKQFRELGSKCPGHPQYHLTSGVEMTTGPLGQGCATSIGMAIAARWLASHFNHQSAGDMEAYERLIGDGIKGDLTLFSRQDSAEAQWRIVDPILGFDSPVYEYKPGTWGPPQSDEIARKVGGWRNPTAADIASIVPRKVEDSVP